MSKNKETKNKSQKSDYLSKFNIKCMLDDGNCFYHAVAHQLILLNVINSHTNNFHTYQELRKIACDGISNMNIDVTGIEKRYNKVTFKDISEYVAYHMQDKNWADQGVIESLAKKLNITINIHNSGINSSGITIINPNQTNIINIEYTGSHYNSLIPLVDNNISDYEKYEYYDDDSSSEDEEKKEYEHFDFEYDVIDGIKEAKKNISNRFNNHDIQDDCIKLSFIVHELGIRVMKSPKVRKKYYPDKRTKFGKSNVLSKDKLSDIITESITKFSERLKIKIDQNKVNNFKNVLLSNPRKLLKICSKEDYKSLAINTLELDLKNIKPILSKLSKNQINKVESEIDILKSHRKKLLLEIEKEYKNTENFLKVNQNSEYPFSAFEKELIKRIHLEKISTLQHSVDSLDQNIFSMVIQLKQLNSLEVKDSLKSELLKLISNHVRSENKKQSISKPVRSELDKYSFNSSEVKSDNNYTSLVKLIALSRLMASSIKRSYKNKFEDNDQKIFGSKSFKSDTMLSEKSIIELHKIGMGGSKTTMVQIDTIDYRSGSYVAINNTIQKIKKLQNIKDKDIVSWIRSILKGEQIKIKNETVSIQTKEQIKEFITSLSYLLFITETFRNPASFIVHQMALDLIEKEKLSFKDAFVHIEKVVNRQGKEIEKEFSGGLMPMLWTGVIESVILLHDLYPTSMNYEYDKRITPTFGKFSNKTKKETKNYTLFKTIIINEAKIVEEWISLHEIDEDNMYKIVQKIASECENWYGVKVLTDVVLKELNKKNESDDEENSESNDKLKENEDSDTDNSKSDKTDDEDKKNEYTDITFENLDDEYHESSTLSLFESEI